MDKNKTIGHIIYIDDNQKVNNIMSEVPKFCSNNPNLELDTDLKKIIVKDGFDAIKKVEERYPQDKKNSKFFLRAVICEATIPTLGDTAIIVEYLFLKYQKEIKIGIVAEDFVDLDEYPFTINNELTLFPAACFNNSYEIKHMLKKMFFSK